MNQVDLMTPEKVAAQYGGDKRKIAQAASMGVIDPTVAVMAGMFIDRMRNAAASEQAPNTTVAQDVMAPPAPQPQMQGAPQAQPAMGLEAAAAAPVERGLEAIPVPEEMYDEQSFAGGGIVAFQQGGEIEQLRAAFAAATDPAQKEALRQQLQLAELGANWPSIPEKEAYYPYVKEPVLPKGTKKSAYELRKELETYGRYLDGGAPPTFAPTLAQRLAEEKAAPPTKQAPKAEEKAPPKRAPAGPRHAPRGAGEVLTPAPAASASAAPATANMPLFDRASQIYTEHSKFLGEDPVQKRLMELLTKQEEEATRDKDLEMYRILGDIGRGISSTGQITNRPVSFLESIGAGLGEATKSMAERKKAYRDAEYQRLKDLAQVEGMTRAEKKAALQAASAEADKNADRQFEREKAAMEAKTRLQVAGMQLQGTREGANAARMAALDETIRRNAEIAAQNVRANLTKISENAVSPQYQALKAAIKNDPNYIENMAEAARIRYLQQSGAISIDGFSGQEITRKP